MTPHQQSGIKARPYNGSGGCNVGIIMINDANTGAGLQVKSLCRKALSQYLCLPAWDRGNDHVLFHDDLVFCSKQNQ